MDVAVQTRMRAGGGDTGNLPPRALKEATASGVKLKVTQGLATSGGRDAETLAEAEKRIPAILRHRERAVTEGVNVGYDVYRIKTKVTQAGGKVDKGFLIDHRSKASRKADTLG